MMVKGPYVFQKTTVRMCMPCGNHFLELHHCGFYTTAEALAPATPSNIIILTNCVRLIGRLLILALPEAVIVIADGAYYIFGIFVWTKKSDGVEFAWAQNANSGCETIY